MTTADELLLRALGALNRALERCGEPNAIIGGIAAIARGIPRHTGDIDAAVWSPNLDKAKLLRVLETEGIVPRIPDALAFAQQSQVVLLVHSPTGTEIDLSFGWLDFEREAMARAERIDFGGVLIPVVRPEDLIIYKAIAWRDRDKADIKRLLDLYGSDLDTDRILRIVAEFCEALDQPEVAAELEALIAAGGENG